MHKQLFNFLTESKNSAFHLFTYKFFLSYKILEISKYFVVYYDYLKLIVVKYICDSLSIRTGFCVLHALTRVSYIFLVSA
jgi:hypothetical protein